MDLDAYIAKIRKLEKSFDTLEGDAVKRLAELVNQTAKEVRAALVDASEFSAFHLHEIQKGVKEAVGFFSAKYGRSFSAYLDDAHAEGEAFAGGMLNVVGIEPDVIVGVAPAVLSTLQGYSAELIRGVSDDLLRRINTEVQLGVLGNKSPYDVMQAIGGKLEAEGATPSIFDSFFSRAETITRTEMNRVFSISTHATLDNAQRLIGPLKKQWLATSDDRTRAAHRAADGQIVPFDDFFTVGGEKLKYPLDPAGSAGNTINCRCRMIPISEEGE